MVDQAKVIVAAVAEIRKKITLISQKPQLYNCDPPVVPKLIFYWSTIASFFPIEGKTKSHPGNRMDVVLKL